MRKIITVSLTLIVALTLLNGCALSGRAHLGEKETIIFLGDSVTAAGVRPGGYIVQFSEVIAKTYPNRDIKVVGAGISGNRVPDCQKRLDRDVLQKEPTIVVIYIGINDVWHWTHPAVVAAGRKGTTKEDFESGLYDIIGRIQKSGARVILCTPTVIGEKTDGMNDQDTMMNEYAEISRKVATKTGTQLLDLRVTFMDYLKEHNPDNASKGILTRDGVHLNDTGNRFLANIMLNALNVPHGN